MTIAKLNNGDSAATWRSTVNEVIDVANLSLTADTFVGPPGPIGPTGPQGPKGDPGTYGVNLGGLVGTEGELPIGTPGDAYGVGTPDELNLYVYDAVNGWTNYGFLTSRDDRNVENSIFVAPDGDDVKDGRTFGKALKTLEAAAEAATALGGSTCVFVYPGTYQTNAHLDWPDRCTVLGVGGARKTIIEPGPIDEDGDPKNRNVFRIGDAGYVEGFSFQGFEVHNPGDPTNWHDDPYEGFAIAFRPGARINRVPYAHNITVYNPFPSRNLVSAPLDRANANPLVGPGGGIAVADGEVISTYSAFPNIMTWGATPSSPNGIGYLAKRGGFLNPINAICIWAHKHFMVQAGAQMVLSGCSSQFGDYSLWSEGASQVIAPKAPAATLFSDITAANQIEANTATIIDTTWGYISTQPQCGCVCTPTEYETFTRADLTYLLRALQLAVRAGDPKPTYQFVRGLFKWDGSFITDDMCRTVYANWWRYMGGVVNTYVSGTNAKAMVTALINAVATSVESPTFRRSRSLLTAINHQWTFPLAGVTKDAVPPRFRNNGRASRIKQSVVQRDGGRVRYSGQDDEGNAVFVGGLEIEARSGELRGPPFDAAVRRRATRITFARNYR